MKRSITSVAVCSGLMMLGLPFVASAAVVNVDINGNPTGGDTTHVGDDGPLSSPGGTFWNGIIAGALTVNMPDEFGGATPTGIAFLSGPNGATYNDAGINNLQDSGTFSPVVLFNLDPNVKYSVAVYMGHNGGFNVFDATGSSGFIGVADPGADGWSLPGTQAVDGGQVGDYYLLSGLTPFEVVAGSGVYGLQFNPDGAFTGFQITAVPEPATLSLLALGGLAMLRRRTRSA